MKILEPGNGQRGWSTKATCTGNGNGGGGCGAKLLVEQADLMKTTSSSMGDVEHHATFECAACSVLTDIPNGKIPGNVWSQMPSVPSGRRRGHSAADR